MDYLDESSEGGGHVDVKRRIVVEVVKWLSRAPMLRQIVDFTGVELERIQAVLSAEPPQTLAEPRHC